MNKIKILSRKFLFIYRYKDYELISSDDHAKFTDRNDNTVENVENILLDIILLSQCEYVVCTLSSNVGRVVYELMSLKYTYVSKRVVSLDKDFYFE